MESHIAFFTNAICIIIFTCFALKIYNTCKHTFPYILLLLILHGWQLMSCAYLESGVFVTDYNAYSYYSGSTIRLTLLLLLFYLAIYSVLQLYERKGQTTTGYQTKRPFNFFQNPAQWVLIICTGVVLLFLLNAVISGNTLTNAAISRFNFYSSYSKIGFTTLLEPFLWGFTITLGMVFSESLKENNRNQKRWSLCLLAGLLLYKFLIGVEFSTYLYLIIVFIAPFWAQHFIGELHFTSMNPRVLKVLGISFIVLLILIMPKYLGFQDSALYSGVANSAFERLMYRGFALQAEVWWQIDTQVWNNVLLIDPQQIGKELLSTINDDLKYDSGIYYLTRNTLVSARMYDFAEMSTLTLNSGFPAIFVAETGYIGASIFMVVCGTMFSLFVLYLRSKIINRQYFRAFLAGYLYFQLFQFLFMGGFWYLGRIPVIVFSSILILLEIATQLTSRHQMSTINHRENMRMNCKKEDCNG